MSKVLSLIAEREAEIAQQKAAKAERQKTLNAQLLAEARNDLRSLFGDLTDELEGYVYRSLTQMNSEVLTGVEWWLGNQELQLAPTQILWSPKQSSRSQSNEMMVRVNDGGNGKDWYRVDHEKFTGEILLAMRQAYGQLMEAEKRDKEKEAARQAQERKNEINRLMQEWRWADYKSEKDVMQEYDSLVALGESDLAETKLAEWRQAVAVAAQKEAERQARETAHEAAVTEWRAACKAWAEEWTAKLWEPWYLWNVRYVAVDMYLSAERDEERYTIETIHTLDEPADIVAAIANSRVALVDQVDYFGNVTPGFALASFLDGKRVVYADAKIDDSLAHHRSFFAGGYHVNVPAFVLQDPGPAPRLEAVASQARPGATEGCANLDETDSDDTPF